jgi:hypothetical protein
MLLLYLYKEGLVSKNLSPINIKFVSLWVFIIETRVRLGIGSCDIYKPVRSKTSYRSSQKQNCIRKLYVHINNSYRINVYRFRAFWLDKSIVTCLFLIRT